MDVPQPRARQITQVAPVEPMLHPKLDLQYQGLLDILHLQFFMDWPQNHMRIWWWMMVHLCQTKNLSAPTQQTLTMDIDEPALFQCQMSRMWKLNCSETEVMTIGSENTVLIIEMITVCLNFAWFFTTVSLLRSRS